MIGSKKGDNFKNLNFLATCEVWNVVYSYMLCNACVFFVNAIFKCETSMEIGEGLTCTKFTMMMKTPQIKPFRQLISQFKVASFPVSSEWAETKRTWKPRQHFQLCHFDLSTCMLCVRHMMRMHIPSFSVAE